MGPMLIDEIIDLAADNKDSIGVLLRKCLVLAYEIKNGNLKSWATKELNGYESDDELPEYRVTSAPAMGNFSGWGGAQTNGFPIPPAVLEERHRNWATTFNLRQGIGAYEHLIKQAKPEGQITAPWPSDLSLYYQDRIPLTSGDKLISAYQEIPTPNVVEFLETVRNRVLSFALEIKAEIMQDDRLLTTLTPAMEKRVDQIFIQQISGGNFHFASGGSTINVHQQNIEIGNRQQLEEILQNSGLSHSELKELTSAVDSDQGKMGSSVAAWIKEAAPKVVSGGVKIGAAVGQAILTEYLKRYFGLPS